MFLIQAFQFSTGGVTPTNYKALNAVKRSCTRLTAFKGLCLNSIRQKDSRGALVTSFRVGRFSEILGNSNMAAVPLTQFANEQSRHIDKLDKYVLIYLARKRNIFDECLKPLSFNVVVDCQFITAALFKLHCTRI